MNQYGATPNSLGAVTRQLENALTSSYRLRIKAIAKNAFKIDKKTLENLKDRTVIFNNQINSIDFELHNVVYDALLKLKKVEYNHIKAEISIDQFIKSAFLMGINLNDLIEKIELTYIDIAMKKYGTYSEAARRLGLKRTTLVEKRKRAEKKIGLELSEVPEEEPETVVV